MHQTEPLFVCFLYTDPGRIVVLIMLFRHFVECNLKRSVMSNPLLYADSNSAT